MFSLATTLSILFQEIKQDTRRWITWHAPAKSGKLRQAGEFKDNDPFSAFKLIKGRNPVPGTYRCFAVQS